MADDNQAIIAITARSDTPMINGTVAAVWQYIMKPPVAKSGQ